MADTPIPPVIRACKTCRFWEQFTDWPGPPIVGECRFSPPRVNSGWPRSGENKWCGKWTERTDLSYARALARIKGFAA